MATDWSGSFDPGDSNIKIYPPQIYEVAPPKEPKRPYIDRYQKDDEVKDFERWRN